jgi:hypothetical protein
MDHPVFGPIEWQESMHWWTGRIRIDFFSGYDTAATASAAARRGVPFRPGTTGAGYQRGEVELRLITRGKDQPSPAQERAFLQFVEHRETICRIVVNAVFDYYRGNWGDWRWVVEPGRAAESTDDLLIPELTTSDGLKSLIRLEALHVVDVQGSKGALLGFCFDCTWDQEHGLGVLVRRGELFEIGENEITWRTTDRGEPRGAPSTPTERQINEQRGIAAIKQLGGSVRVEDGVTGRMKIELRNIRLTTPVSSRWLSCRMHATLTWLPRGSQTSGSPRCKHSRNWNNWTSPTLP